LIGDIAAQKLARTQQAVLNDDPGSANTTIDIDVMKQAIEATLISDNLLAFGISLGDIEEMSKISFRRISRVSSRTCKIGLR